MTGKTLVTGGSGYVAGFLIKQLIEQGWSVNTTIRKRSREDAVRQSLGLAGDARLTVFEADLEDDAGWVEAMAGCSHVAHVASPFPTGVPKDENELIVPAREGALRALRFAKDAGVTRFVLTSSAAAIAYGHGKGNRTFTEADWTNLDAPGVMPYIKSKTIAERAARDWVAAQGGGIEFCSVNPSAIIGPLLGRDTSASIELIKRLLDGSLPALPDFGFGLVDVRDVADLHYRALTAPGMAGERFVCSGPFLKMVEIAAILRDRLGPRAAKVPTRRMPNWLLRTIALFRSELRQITGELGNTRNMDSTHAREVLGWVPRPPEESIEATAESLFALGLVKAPA